MCETPGRRQTWLPGDESQCPPLGSLAHQHPLRPAQYFDPCHIKGHGKDATEHAQSVGGYRHIVDIDRNA